MKRREVMKWMGSSAAWSLIGSSNFLVACNDQEGMTADQSITLPMGPVLPENDSWWLSGNFAPVDELETDSLTVIGEIPSTLSGTYVRNGPNPSRNESTHWFTGDGMLHGVRIEEGQAIWYRSRYVKTDYYHQPSEPGTIPDLKTHQANTSIIKHGNHWLSLSEAGLPYEVTPDLETVGVFDYDGVLDHAMTAHPKLDPTNGDLHFFGYSISPAAFRYHKVDATGQIKNSASVALPGASMIHDFQVTSDYIVFMDLPVVLDFELAISGDLMPFRWKDDYQTRIGLIPHGDDGSNVRWFNLDPCFVFHTVNAYQSTEQPQELILTGVRYQKIWEDSPNDLGDGGMLWEWKLNLETGESSTRQLSGNLVEFPVINPLYQSRDHRYSYALSPSDENDTVFSSIIKFDRDGEAQHFTPLAKKYYLGELKVIPKPQATEEDEAWLIGYAYHVDTRLSELIILDAQHLDQPPVARVLLPQRVPFGFHGAWIEG